MPRFTSDALTILAHSLLGTRYTDDGLVPDTGFDCWGLVRYCYAVSSLLLPGSIREASHLFRRAPEPWKPGDIVVMVIPGAPRRHLALVIDDPWILQCSRVTNGVARCERTRMPWQRWVKYAVRYQCS